MEIKITLNPEVNWTYSKFEKTCADAFKAIPPEKREEIMKVKYQELTGKKLDVKDPVPSKKKDGAA